MIVLCMMQEHFLLLPNKGFRLSNFLQSASWFWITKGDFLMSVNVMVSCNVLSRWIQLISIFLQDFLKFLQIVIYWF